MGIAFRPQASTRPGAVDPRFTFARRHFQEVRTDTRQVLAVEEVRRAIDARNPSSRRPGNSELLESFFYAYPDAKPVYESVRIRRVDQPHRDWADLTDLLLDQDVQNESPGIVLVARSGAGKTVAALKAFLDCLSCGPMSGRPRLAGYLPIWVDLRGDRDISAMILGSLKGDSGPDHNEANWLRNSPPLLQFFDLNTTSAGERAQIAERLVQFQKDHASMGHRCVVGYRLHDTNMDFLRDSTFVKYDLEPLKEDSAEQYLKNIRHYEGWAFKRSGLEPPKYDLEAECKQLHRLIRQHTSGQDSIISTPLLMHWVSLLSGDKLAKVKSVSDLYDQVVDQKLEREFTESSHAFAVFGTEKTVWRDSLRTGAMTESR